ncbi:MAG: CpaF family protein [Lachnospiraceae bacterium]|nr:CpaF family protein [Lachnospiraceae bacterium]
MKEIKTLTIERIDLSRECSDEEVNRIIFEVILERAREKYIPLVERKKLERAVFNALRKLDFIQDLLEEETVSEIMINGPDVIFVEREGKITRLGKTFESVEKLEDMIQQIVASCNRSVNENSPIADARLPDGSRVNIVLSPPAIGGPVVTIRRFPNNTITMDSLIENGTVTQEAADFLKQAVESGMNIFVSGGTSSGKTTMLNVLSGFIPNELRVVCIEDSAELQIHHIPNLIRLETRNSTQEGCSEISIRDLIRNALRMRPDRIIVGEVRGGEAMDMLQAFNTGHDGSLSTGHANSASDMLLRLEAMVLMGTELPIGAIRRQIATGIDLIVHLERRRSGKRKVVEIMEILGMEGEEIKKGELFRMEENENGEGRLICVKKEMTRKRGYPGEWV